MMKCHVSPGSKIPLLAILSKTSGLFKPTESILNASPGSKTGPAASTNPSKLEIDVPTAPTGARGSATYQTSAHAIGVRFVMATNMLGNDGKGNKRGCDSQLVDLVWHKEKVAIRVVDVID